MKLLEIHNIAHSHMVDVLKHECADYINVLTQTRGAVLLRGSTSGQAQSGVLKTIEPRDHRRPKDTDAAVHFYLNSKLEQKFGYKFRNGVFATSDFDIAYQYGNVSVVFPIGPLKFIWSPKILDLYTYLQDVVQLGNMHSDETSDLLDHIAGMYQNTNLAEAIRTHREVMLANKCYMVTLEDYNAIREELVA